MSNHSISRLSAGGWNLYVPLEIAYFDALPEVGIYVLFQFLQSIAGPLVPSEAVAAGATILGMDLFSVTVLGAVGSTVGNLVNYALAKRAGRPVLGRLSSRLFVKLEAHLKRRGLFLLVLLSMAPLGISEFVAYVAGLFDVEVKFFVSMTYVGTLVRILLISSLLAMIFV